MRIVKHVVLLSILIAILSINVNADYTNSDLNLRAGPNTESKIIRVIPKGDQVIVFRWQDNWVRVKYKDDFGYVCGDYLQEPELEYLGNYFITAYEETGELCANGAYPTVGYTIAHNTLPFGTEVYIDGIGYRTVEDRGPSYLGSEWLDLYLGDPSACYQWGEQYRDVYLVNKEK